MGSDRISKPQRQQAIRDLLARNEIHTQEQLEALLGAEGISVAQATLSRDLRELGAVKSSRGYCVGGLETVSTVARSAVGRVISEFVVSAESGGSLVILRTQRGRAATVARAIDDSDLAQVVGTVAGADTVLVATRSTTQAGDLRWQIRKLLRR